METQALHFAELKLAISPNVGDSGAQFLVGGGDCVRASPVSYNSNRTCHYNGMGCIWGALFVGMYPTVCQIPYQPFKQW